MLKETVLYRVLLPLLLWLATLALPADAFAGAKANPNLMILFGTNWSMNYMPNNTTQPTVSSPTKIVYDSSGNTINAEFNDLANQSTSKFYIGKQALDQLLSDSVSDNINFGFATYRQLFGLDFAATKFRYDVIWRSATPKTDISGLTTTQRYAYATDRNNFSNADLSIVENGITFNLCNVYYDSENAGFGRMYLAANGAMTDDPWIQWDFVSTWYPYHNEMHFDYNTDPNYRIKDSSNTNCQYMANSSYHTYSWRQGNKTPAGNRIYANQVPEYAAGISTGQSSGWSGEVTYTETDATTWAGTWSSSYPASHANPDSTNRKWVSNKTQLTAANHMGVFLNLPATDGTTPYIDNRSIIKVFMRRNQMDSSGLEYHPDKLSSANIANTRSDPSSLIDNNNGIRASSFPWNGHQSPIYDSLQNALAYFKTYKAQDPLDSCRSNNILIFYDGKENIHFKGWGKYDQELWPPADVAKELYEKYNVKTYVVLLSTDTAAKTEAAAIATAGGTALISSVIDGSDPDVLKTLTSSFKAVFLDVGNNLKGEYAPAAPAVPKIMNPTTSNYIYLPGTDYTSNAAAGFFKAYSIDYTTGVIAKAPSWDAASLMTADKRTAALKTAKADGSIISFSDAANSEFEATPPPNPNVIQKYTIDPSFSSGQYLGGRKDGSFLGVFSQQSMAPVLLWPPSTVAYFADNTYISFAKSNKTRSKRVLFHNDDGFLYAIDASSGELAWAWMPRQFLKLLKDYSKFWQNGNMRGGLTVVDAPYGSSYATYVVGTAQSGALHYALRLDSDGAPAQVSWLNEVTSGLSPLEQAPTVTYLTTSGTTKAYANYLTAVGTTFTLYVHEVGDNKTPTSSNFSFTSASTTISSQLIADRIQNTDKSFSTYLYFGDSSGKIWKMTANTTAAATVNTKEEIGTTYNNLAAKYVGAYRWNNVDYIWAAGDTGITVFEHHLNADGTTYTWNRRWESHVGGAGYWTNGTTYTADTGGIASGIQTIPSGYTVSAAPVVEKGALIVPISGSASSSGATVTCGSGEAGDAYYYFYNLADGHFPTNKFKVNNQYLTTNIKLGAGAALSPVLTMSKSGRFVVGTAQQADTNASSRAESMRSEGGSSGVIAWREMTN
jgi:hypothetical protein